MRKFLPGIIALIVLGHLARAESVSLFNNMSQPVEGAIIISETRHVYASAFETGSQATLVTEAGFYGVNYDTTDHQVILSIYTNAAGKPGDWLGSFTPISISAGSNLIGPTTGSILLSANATYWITYQLAENITGSYLGFFYTGSAATASGSQFSVSPLEKAFSADGGITWNADTAGSLQFSLSGSAVPEPSIAALLALGIGAYFLRRGRQV